MRFDYLIVGGGLSAASAVEGIRTHDERGSIGLISRENFPPYHRPPLSKGLWFGKDTMESLSVQSEAWYREHNAQLILRREVVEMDADLRRVWDDHGNIHEYGKLLLATGGEPRRLSIEGAELDGIHYYRQLEDYLALRNSIQRVRHALVVGGGFIGMEISAALRHAGIEVTLLYPEEYPLRRVLPRDLGLFVADFYRQKGVETVSGETVAKFEMRNGEITATTQNHNQVTTELVVVGVGLVPETTLADAAGLATGNGITVDEFGRTSDTRIYACGDVAEFPCLPLGRAMRVEHWEHALAHGKAVGACMAGSTRGYDHLPMFYSDLFELGWEAVGLIDSSLPVHAVWREAFKSGVIFYLEDDAIRGALLWNVWDAVEWARGLIREARVMSGAEREELVAALPV
jgi:NADPH-dependent 2,4-dienoyl-CoA reductase/sulfur reductase-like enzyme